MELRNYSEAIEIMRYAQKKGVKTCLTHAMLLAQFSFPMERKLRMIDMIVAGAGLGGGNIWSLRYFMEPFRAAESDFHKGKPPKKGEMMKVSEILGIRV